jgi:hypothetical protein
MKSFLPVTLMDFIVLANIVNMIVLEKAFGDYNTASTLGGITILSIIVINHLEKKQKR